MDASYTLRPGTRNILVDENNHQYSFHTAVKSSGPTWVVRPEVRRYWRERGLVVTHRLRCTQFNASDKITRLVAFQDDKRNLVRTMRRPGNSTLPETSIRPHHNSSCAQPLTISYMSDKTGRDLFTMMPDSTAIVRRRIKEDLKRGPVVDETQKLDRFGRRRSAAATQRPASTRGSSRRPNTTGGTGAGADARRARREARKAKAGKSGKRKSLVARSGGVDPDKQTRRLRVARERFAREVAATQAREKAERAAQAAKEEKERLRKLKIARGAGRRAARFAGGWTPSGETKTGLGYPRRSSVAETREEAMAKWKESQKYARGKVVPKGLIDGTIRVPLPRAKLVLEEVVKKMGTLRWTDYEKNGAAIHVVIKPADYERFIEALDQLTEHDFQFLAALPNVPPPNPEQPGPYHSVVPVKSAAEKAAEQQAFLAEERYKAMVEAKERAEGESRATRELFMAVDKNNDPHINFLCAVGIEAGGMRHKPRINFQRANDGNTPLAVAAMRAQDGCVRVLLRYGADPSKKNDKGQTPLHLAQNCKSHARERMDMRVKGAVERFASAAECVAALEHRSLMTAAKENDLRRVRFLTLIKGEDPVIPNVYGMTPLHFAVMNRNYKMIRFLVNQGADPTFRNNIGQCPLEMAEGMTDNKVLVRELKKAHALHIVERRKQEIIEHTMRAEADRALAVEMRQFARGTSKAEGVFDRFPQPQPGFKPAVPKHLREKRDPLRNSRFMFTKTRGHHSSANIAKGTRYDNSIDALRLPDSASGSRGRLQRRYLAATGGARALADMELKGGAGSASDVALRRNLPKAADPKFEDFTRMVYGSIA